MSPELPFLAAGTIAVIGGTRKSGGFPRNGMNAVVATVVLVIVASATGDTPVAPAVHAIGLLVLLAASMAAVKDFQAKKVTT
jgi:peptidoglycan/LPS O-acetylase OafA/YrhL